RRRRSRGGAAAGEGGSQTRPLRGAVLRLQRLTTQTRRQRRGVVLQEKSSFACRPGRRLLAAAPMRRRSTRRLLVFLCCSMGFLAVPSSHSADERGSAAVPDPVARDTTTTAGAIPDELVGRWLAVIEAKPLSTDLQEGAGQAIVLRTFEIAKTGEGLAVHVHRGQLPDDLKLRIDSRTIGVKRGAAPVASPAAGSVDAMSAPPAADVIAAVARAWPGLATPPPKDERTIATKLSAADSAASADKEQMNPINARFLLTIEDPYSPPEARPTRSLSTLAIVDVARNRLSGQAVQALMLPA